MKQIKTLWPRQCAVAPDPSRIPGRHLSPRYLSEGLCWSEVVLCRGALYHVKVARGGTSDYNLAAGGQAGGRKAPPVDASPVDIDVPHLTVLSGSLPAGCLFHQY